MKTLTGIPGGIAPRPPVSVDPGEPLRSVASASGEASVVDGPAAVPTPAPETDATQANDLAGAVARLRDAIDQLPGPEREVELLYENDPGEYVVEIRNKESGELLQRFPPEKLLNHRRDPADLLGTVIDRRS
jgi:uncharacterized FlaG/YvyC family protein